MYLREFSADGRLTPRPASAAVTPIDAAARTRGSRRSPQRQNLAACAVWHRNLDDALIEVVVNVTDASVKFTMPDGKTEENTNKAGDADWSDEVTHLPENTGDAPMEAVLIEIK